MYFLFLSNSPWLDYDLRKYMSSIFQKNDMGATSVNT